MKTAKDTPLLRRESPAAIHSILLKCGSQTLNLLDHKFHVSHRGMSFTTDSYFDPFTSLGIRLELPPALGRLHARTIQCEGVVVECRGDHKRRVYRVTVTFLNLNPEDAKQLALASGMFATVGHPAATCSRQFPASTGRVGIQAAK